MKITVQWLEGIVYRNMTVDSTSTRNNNTKVTFNGRTLLAKDLRTGAEINELVGKEWVRAGRIVHGTWFLGEGLSKLEYNQTPEAHANNQRIEQSYRETKVAAE